MKKTLTILALTALITPLIGFANAGDEDKEMFNTGVNPDREAVKKADAGWHKESLKTHDRRIAWWKEARFGMFVHWGVYSVAGGEWKGVPVGGYAEHLMRVKKITKADYLEFSKAFNPDKFDAEAWVQKAKNAGMRYLVVTAKHHDGMAMYPSKVSDWNITTRTPFKRDPMAELAAACKKEGLKFGFYYSHAFDWEHPDAPGNDWEFKNPGGDLGLYGGGRWYDLHPELIPKAVKYVDEKAIPQIRELITTYHPDILWFDTPSKLPFSENLRILEAIRATDPNIVVNGRLAQISSRQFGDYANTCDRPAEFFPVTGDWEGIPTTNESYGYSRFDRRHKSAAFFVRLLANAVSRNGNLLMNIGPMGDGAFDGADDSILAGISTWMSRNGESIHGAGPADLQRQNWGVATRKGDTLYLHVFTPPKDGVLHVGGLTPGGIVSAKIPGASGNNLQVAPSGAADAAITLPAEGLDAADTVIAVALKPGNTGAPSPVMFLAPKVPVTRLLAFDATKTGKGFRHADGKAGNDQVENWTSTEQSLSWTLRTEHPETYDLSLRAKSYGDGTACLLLDGKPVVTFGTADQKNGVKALGSLTLAPGTHTLELKAIKINKDFLAPAELTLIAGK